MSGTSPLHLLRTVEKMDDEVLMWLFVSVMVSLVMYACGSVVASLGPPTRRTVIGPAGPESVAANPRDVVTGVGAPFAGGASVPGEPPPVGRGLVGLPVLSSPPLLEGGLRSDDVVLSFPAIGLPPLASESAPLVGVCVVSSSGLHSISGRSSRCRLCYRQVYRL